ncbi:MAG: PASTA domain-containing protein, partial [Ramlibacter sp.]|nr:PASTA domain-containing protein [Cryobacterium sp.]
KASIGTTDPIFDGDVDAGLVISASRESDAGDVSQGGDYFEGMKVNLVVSLGSVPDVSGKSVEDATAILAEKGLVAQEGDRVFSDSFADGTVIKSSPSKDGPVHAGDAITLTISKGPDVVEVPTVVTGQSVATARKQLEDLGFKVTSNVPQFLEGAVIASKQDPTAGTKIKRGSSISVNYVP